MADSRIATGPAAPPNDRGHYEWSAQVNCRIYDLDGSYSVHIFLGNVPDDPKEMEFCPDFVYSHCVYSDSVPEEVKNDPKANYFTKGLVLLNDAIVRHPELRSLEPDVVVPYLTKNIHWRVLKANGEPAKLDSLEVIVSAEFVTYPPGAVFPVYGEKRRYDSITYGRDGGSRHQPTR